MGISTMLKLLQEKESGKIVLVNIGNFYVASGKDAVLLNKILDLKLTCLEKGICKVGFPISALEKYTNKIQEKQYSYIVYRYIAKEVKLEITKIHKAKNKNEITQEKANCLLCKGIKAYPKEDKYIEAVAKLYEKEDEINRAKEQRKKRKIWFQKKNKQNKLALIPKAENYIEYMLQMILKLPRTEKYSIGTEYKQSLYIMLKDIIYLSKIQKECILEKLNEIDANLNTQRIYLRIMKKQKWTDEKNFNIAMEKIYEIGKIIGGLYKYYAKYSKE